MENNIVLTARNKEELDKLINESLEKGYLIMGEPYLGDDNQLMQKMCKAKNIDLEMKTSAYLQYGFLAIFVVGVALIMMK